MGDVAEVGVVRRKCPVPHCTTTIPREYLMCAIHYARIPWGTRLELKRAFTRGQQFGRVKPSARWITALKRAIAEVGAKDATRGERGKA